MQPHHLTLEAEREQHRDQSSIILTWTDFSNAANGYTLMYGTQPGQYQWGVPVISEYSQNNSFTVNYLNPGQTYYFVLNAYQGSTYVATTGPIAVTAAGGMIATAPAAAPAPMATGANPWVANPVFGVSATKGTQPGTITLTWADPQNLANNYALTYGTTPSASQYGVMGIQEGPGGMTSFTVGALASGQTYYFTLVAFQGGTFVRTSQTVVAAVAK